MGGFFQLADGFFIKSLLAPHACQQMVLMAPLLSHLRELVGNITLIPQKLSANALEFRVSGLQAREIGPIAFEHLIFPAGNP